MADEKSFLVSGTAITLSAQGLLKMPKRKFYNAGKFFNDNQYRHEIANNYKDFKLRRRIRQRKRRANLYNCGKVEVMTDLSLDYLQELPIPVHVFPNFEKVYTPRGHQKFCTQRRPVLIYNDTINRIQSSKENTELLKSLAKKQVERLERQSLRKKWSNVISTTSGLNICKVQQNKQHCAGTLENINFSKRQQQFKSGGTVIRPLSEQGRSAGNVTDGTLEYYMQLATDFYQNGFLRNIKYLENLGERNQLRRTRHIQQEPPQQQQQQQQAKFHTFAHLSETVANSVETQHTTDASLDSCDRKQNQINQNNPIVWHKNKLEVNEFPLNNSKITNCAIRVDIRPQTFHANQQQANFFVKKIYGKKKTAQEPKDFISMNDYLNGNLTYSQLLQQQQRARTFYRHTASVNNHNCAEKALLLDNLIDNLKELDIQENRTNLPRITLTDYTNKYPNELETNYQPQAATPAKEKHLHSYLIKQSSLDCSQLDIPLETHFQSEARPP